MAFDHLGTFNKSQLERLLAFARTQIGLVDARIQHASAEMNRLGVVAFRYEQGVPKQYRADPPDSYLGKLLATYEVLGGNPFHDLRVRLRQDPVFAIRGTETVPTQFMNNGEVIPGRGLADGPSAELVRRARTWVDDTIRMRFDRIERKIRRAIDNADELQKEIDDLTVIKQAIDVPGSLEQLASQLQSLIADPNYRAIFDDGGKDPFGFTSYAPFSSYDVVSSVNPNIPDRTTETAQRQNSGYVGPGEKG